MKSPTTHFSPPGGFFSLSLCTQCIDGCSLYIENKEWTKGCWMVIEEDDDGDEAKEGKQEYGNKLLLLNFFHTIRMWCAARIMFHEENRSTCWLFTVYYLWWLVVMWFWGYGVDVGDEVLINLVLFICIRGITLQEEQLRTCDSFAIIYWSSPPGSGIDFKNLINLNYWEVFFHRIFEAQGHCITKHIQDNDQVVLSCEDILGIILRYLDTWIPFSLCK